MKKRLIALTLTGLMAVSLAACGGGSASSTAPAATAGGSESTAGGSAAASSSGYTVSELKVNIWDNNQKAGLQQIADEWTAESGVKVSIEVVDWDNYWTLLEAGASGGQMPDVFWMHSNTAQMYMENDLLLNLDSYIEADDTIDLSKYYEGVVKLYNRADNGSQYALPKDHDTIALLYNKALFDKYGVEYPNDDWTWEDLRDAAAKITEAGKADQVYGFAMNTSNNQDGWYNIVYDYGAQIITDDHKGTTIGSDEGKAAMEMLRQILEVAAPQATVAETGTENLFKSGKTAMISQGSWMINSFYTAENAADYAWAMLPYADTNGNGACDEGERYSAYNGLGWAAAANTKDPKAAYDLISYFCSEKAQKEQASLGVTMGGMLGVSEDFANAFEGMDVSAFVRAEEEGDLFFRPYTRNTTVWEDALQQNGGFLDAWLDPSNPETMAKACDNAQKIIEDAIAAE
ncbi:MAG: sugar ABC transporter substrate-binding protein [Lachnospiraceae bacterium]|nr:sugar ABC transporter substrate-binding protein [Lachnospiraceae bacterium]